MHSYITNFVYISIHAYTISSVMNDFGVQFRLIVWYFYFHVHTIHWNTKLVLQELEYIILYHIVTRLIKDIRFLLQWNIYNQETKSVPWASLKISTKHVKQIELKCVKLEQVSFGWNKTFMVSYYKYLYFIQWNSYIQKSIFT